MTETIDLLTASEAVQLPTGYAVAMTNLISRLLAKGYNITHMAWQHMGKPLPIISNNTVRMFEQIQSGNVNMHSDRFPLYFERALKKYKPNAVFSLIDFWFTSGMTKHCRDNEIPYINYFPVDAEPFYYDWIVDIMENHTPLGMSKFGVETVEKCIKNFGKGGWTRHFEMDYLYHGVDLQNYKKMSKYHIKANKAKVCGDEDAFCIGVVGKNCDRKQHPRVMEAFAKFLKMNPDAKTYLILKTGDPSDLSGQGHDLYGFAQQLKIMDHIRWADQSRDFLDGVSETIMTEIYNTFDVLASATSGEGFGLPTMEAMACGTPSIITDYTTSKELVRDSGWLIPPVTHYIGNFNSNRAIVDTNVMALAFDDAYKHPDKVTKYAKRAMVISKEFDWDIIADKADEIIKKSISVGV